MDLFVFDPEYEALGILESPMSVDYISRFKTKGEFTVILPSTSFNAQKISKDNVILLDQKEGIAGVIDKVVKSFSSDNIPQITITGSLCEVYLYKRIVWGLYTKSGTIPDIVEDIIRTQVISPIDESRAIPDIEIIPFDGEKGKTIQYQNTGGNVGECISELCSSADFGFSMKYDYIKKKMYFKIIKGTDRTKDVGDVSQCIFSQNYENVLSATYEENYSTYKNVALVAGEDSGTDRKYVTVNEDNQKGKFRDETFVDAKSIRSKNGSEVIPQEQYDGMLEQKGKERLDTVKPVVNFDCVVNPYGNIKYGIDYFLGDKVTMEDNELNVSLDAELSEVEKTFTSSEESTHFVFGYNQLTLAKAIKAKVVE